MNSSDTPAKIVALLPIKAHSERVTGKNFRNFAGKPLFRWILDALTQVEAVSEVVINTDAREILEEHGLTDGGKIRITRPQGGPMRRHGEHEPNP